jgi:hypothetical protein
MLKDGIEKKQINPENNWKKKQVKDLGPNLKKKNKQNQTTRDEIENKIQLEKSI